MATLFSKGLREASFARYRNQWEASLLASAIAATADLDAYSRSQVMRAAFQGAFNGTAFGVYDGDSLGEAALERRQAGPTQWDLVYTALTGVKCVLGRVYQQPDGSWGALVIAGVKDDHHAALAAAEWAIAKLCA